MHNKRAIAPNWHRARGAATPSLGGNLLLTSESEEEEKKPLLEEEGRAGATGKGGSDEVNDGGEGDDAGGEGDWTYRDAYVVGFTCCGAGIVVYATALWWHLNRL